METISNNVKQNEHKPAYKMLTGMFEEYEEAERAYNTLLEHGYHKDEINLMMSQETHKKYFINEDADTEIHHDKTLHGAEVGAAIGATGGAIAGVAIALGISVAIPGLGFVLAGTILAGISGAAAGMITGGLAGALSGVGIPEDKALLYEEGIREGKIVMGVHPHNAEDAKFIENDWLMNNAKQLCC